MARAIEGRLRIERGRIATLEARVEQFDKEFAGGDVPLPSFWGGYRVIPHLFEFWQGRENRLHDRFRYTHKYDGNWQVARLQP